jgi:raffinose/stachyose/melibiose transport system permease protein
MTSLVKYNRKGYFLFLIGGLAAYTYVYIWSLVNGIYFSFTDWNGFARTLNLVGFANYAKIFSNTRFFESLLFTLKYTVLLTVVSNLLGLALALALNRKMKGEVFFRAMYFFPAILSMVTAGLIWNEIMYRVIPLFGQLIGSKALSTTILGDTRLAGYGVLFVHAWQFTAQPFVLFLAGLQAIPPDMPEAAMIDGANVIKVFRYITLPYLLPILEINLVLSLKYGFTVFDYIVAMTGGGPGGATESISVLIWKLGFSETRFAYACAMSVVMFVIIAAIAYFQLVLIRRNEVK